MSSSSSSSRATRLPQPYKRKPGAPKAPPRRTEWLHRLEHLIFSKEEIAANPTVDRRKPYISSLEHYVERTNGHLSKLHIHPIHKSEWVHLQGVSSRSTKTLVIASRDKMVEVRNRVNKLRETNSALEAQIAQLESRVNEMQSPASSPPKSALSSPDYEQ